MELELVESVKPAKEIEVGDIVEITWSTIGVKYNLVMKIDDKYQLRNLDGVCYTHGVFDNLSDMVDYLNNHLTYRIFTQDKFKLKLEKI